MLEHTGHGSFMWRSTRVRAGGNNMIRVHGTWFKPSAYLYLRTSSKTKDRHLGLLQSLLSSNSSSIIRLPRGLVSVHYYKGSQVSLHLVLVSRVSLCLASQVTLRSSTLASSIDCLAKSHTFPHIP